MIRFNLEDLNHLGYFDAGGNPQTQGISSILVTGTTHSYVANFWPPGHIIGYEHTFIATLADFLATLAESKPFYPNFQDALEVQKILEAVEESARTRRWLPIDPGDISRSVAPSP